LTVADLEVDVDDRVHAAEPTEIPLAFRTAVIGDRRVGSRPVAQPVLGDRVPALAPVSRRAAVLERKSG
jgi:hypothetical protein